MNAKDADAMHEIVDALAAEIERYLIAVETFREQGYEPRWSSEQMNQHESLVLFLDDQTGFQSLDRLS
jgi:hypothetical protein